MRFAPPLAVFLCVLTSLVIAGMLCVATLYYLRLPIPFCGQCLYDGAYEKPPPPPVQSGPVVRVDKL